MPSFDLHNIDDQKNFTELDALSYITWFLLAYKPRSSHTRDAVSLHKAYFAMQNEVFDYQWPIGRRTFTSFWLAHGASAAFHYVERFHSSLKLTLNPSSPDFAHHVDIVVQRREEMRQFLARSRGIVELLRNRLDQRAIRAICLPRFPVSLATETVTPPDLPVLTNQVMQEFFKKNKRL